MPGVMEGGREGAKRDTTEAWPVQRAPWAEGQGWLREAALAWASLAQRFPASSVLARAGAGCGSLGDVPGAWLASAPLSPSLWPGKLHGQRSLAGYSPWRRKSIGHD